MNVLRLLICALLLACGDSPIAPASDPLEDIPEHYQSESVNIDGVRVAAETSYDFRAGRWVYHVDIVKGRRIFESGGGYWVGEWDPAEGWAVGWELDYAWRWNFETGQADTSLASSRWTSQVVPRVSGVEISDQEYEYR